MHLVVGLGNPGPRYAETRHNVGFHIVERLGRRWGIPLTKSWQGSTMGDGQFDGHRTLLAMPQQFMNCSGQPVGALMGFYKVPAANLIVVHDDMDIPLGRLRLRQGGGHGGHNGLRDIQRLVTEPFIRVKVGIGRPPPSWDPADYVLGTWTDSDRAVLGQVVEDAANAIEALVREGLERAMNRFNSNPTERPRRAVALST